MPGNVHNVREELRSIGIPYFQRLVLERYGQHVPLEKIRGEFEMEEQALAPSADIIVEPYEITYRGKIHYATSLPTRRLPSDIVAYDPDGYSDEDGDSEDWDEDDSWEDSRENDYDSYDDDY